MQVIEVIIVEYMFRLFSFGACSENPERLQCPHTLNQARMLQFVDRTQVKRKKEASQKEEKSSSKERSKSKERKTDQEKRSKEEPILKNNLGKDLQRNRLKRKLYIIRTG